MSFRVRIRDISFSNSHGKVVETTGQPKQWSIEASTSNGSARATIYDPFELASTHGGNLEGELRWFLENYANDPFETTRADAAAESLSKYGRGLAGQVVNACQIPRNGDLQLEIISSDSREDPRSSVGTERKLQQLHWEVLEDASVWPPGYNLNSISVARSIIKSIKQEAIGGETFTAKKIKILLVVSRPDQQNDIDHQLVSRSLVAIVDHATKNNPKVPVSLKILRPPTWEAFQRELQDNNYDVVHFDMKGEIRKSKRGITE
jgi:hypothetical protein